MCVQCALTTIPPRNQIHGANQRSRFDLSLVIFVEMGYPGNIKLVGALRCDLRLYQSVESVESRFNVQKPCIINIALTQEEVGCIF